MNLTQKAGASSTHSKRLRAVSTLRRLAKRLECVRLAGAFGSWSQCASDCWRWRLPMNHHVAEGILPAVEGRHPAARTCRHPFLRVDCFDAFSAGLEAPALRQAVCLPLRFRGSKREVLFRRILTLTASFVVLLASCAALISAFDIDKSSDHSNLDADLMTTTISMNRVRQCSVLNITKGIYVRHAVRHAAVVMDCNGAQEGPI